MLRKLPGRLHHARFVRQNSLQTADRIPTHLTIDEKRALHQLGTSVTGTFVEIGSYLGASSSFLAAGIQSQAGGANSKLYCVDTWYNDAMSEGNRDTYAEFLANIRQYADIIVPLRMRSDEAARTFSTSVDFLFIDGDHEYHGVNQDWDAWRPHLRDNALVAFHDVGWVEGVQRLVREDVLPIAREMKSLPNLFWARIRA